MNKRYASNKGFSLVELTVVLLIITLLASVAVRETSELAFQTRYEQTRERLDMIKQAILGNPRQIINGQQAVSGFVADMGRLPVSLRELTQRSGDCDNDLGDVNQTECAAVAGTWDSTAWNSNPVVRVDSTGLRYGWNGPYLSISGNPADVDAITDGWGRTSTDWNYGWYFLDWNTLNPPTFATRNLIIQSLGKDQQTDTSLPAGSTSYDTDYPVNLYTAGPGVFYPEPVVRQQDWLVDISNGISVNFIKTSRALPISSCSDPSKLTKATCVAPATWSGLCDKAGFYNADSCTAATGNWGYCSDGVHTTQATCASPSIWAYCSDGVSTTQALCTASTPFGIWMPKGFGCSDQTYATKDICETNSSTWYGCVDGSGAVLGSCTTAWFVSTNDTSILPTIKTPICMKVYYRKPDSSIGVLVSDEKNTNDVDGAVLFDPNVIIADGSAQTIRFTNFRDSASTIAALPQQLIPIGNNALGIYQYDGSTGGCSNNNLLLYPIYRQNPIQVDFRPHATLPVINW